MRNNLFIRICRKFLFPKLLNMRHFWAKHRDIFHGYKPETTSVHAVPF